MIQHDFFASCPRGVESLLANELNALGADGVKETRAGVYFSGGIETLYRICLWSRIASRVLMPIASFRAESPDELYSGAREIAWEEHLDPSGTLAVDCNVSDSTITHSHYAALRIKDAVADRFVDKFGARPSVNLAEPDIRINAHISKNRVLISLDLSGGSLHRRGYREEGSRAPLKENLAAAILMLSGWSKMAARGGTFLDPMCGSGTLVIEAAMIAADIAPGLMRRHFGFIGWKGHDHAAWQTMLEKAHSRRKAGLKKAPVVFGFDIDPAALRAAKGNVMRAGLENAVRLERRDIADVATSFGAAPLAFGAAPLAEFGLLAVNPPYGERLGEAARLRPLYAELGLALKKFTGWKAAVITASSELAGCIGVEPQLRHKLYNGAIPCELLRFDFSRRAAAASTVERTSPETAPTPEGIEMIANRLRKNLKSIGKWAQKSGVTCYRLYDADIPEYAAAVDVYEKWAHVQEYQAPKTVDPANAERRLSELAEAVKTVLGLADGDLFVKVRRRQSGGFRYERLADAGVFYEIGEGGLRFLVNFTDHLDTGIFLDHRITRGMIRDMAKGARFLNLFAYTGTASVYAAAGGAESTTTVDMSATYLDWAERNFAANGISGSRHEFIRANCLEWLEWPERGRFDLIFLDPPTFSNSKGMDDEFDIQRDHVKLIGMAARLLAPGGTLIFSTNSRRFALETASMPGLSFEDMTRSTIPKDFERNPRIHKCWRITSAR
ncbi:MAG: bifunctional 23S rRNA (guanine(2069)-N(7))-methyltransferase RlmK/23S rRNA (guanine(2445)-N(2))-methyltransferase RlmL [Nitrospirae bacterium]|nr:bifunctional 23S rRNA (guanine(2069)-N(7))-methyltransferase RlmK/23S rRNA (guanine(2445)-N(2))-methyltransferase RlmL [Nitrospirota bacterium]